MSSAGSRLSSPPSHTARLAPAARIRQPNPLALPGHALPEVLAASDVLRLQTTLGNHAVGRLFHRQPNAPAPTVPPPGLVQRPVTPKTYAKNPNLLPINTTGLGKTEQKALLDLWRSIVDGTGNLKIKTGLMEGAFKDRMLSGLAKLLETPAGQRLLREINADQEPGHEVVLGSSFKTELKALKKEEPADSQALPSTPGDDAKSMAYSIEQRNPLPEDSLVQDSTRN